MSGTFYSSYENLQKLSENNADRIALASDSQNITYFQMFRLCKNIATNLQKILEDTTFVPLIFERSHYIPLAVHGLQFLNKAHVPLDSSSPDERLKVILQDVSSPVVVGQSKFRERIEALGVCQFLDIDDLLKDSTGKLIVGPPKPRDPIYMIYTSGTTGNPKGVVNIREGLINRAEWQRDHYGLNSHCKFLFKTPYTFDVSMWELTVPFLVGATLVIGGPKIHLKINEVIKTIEKYELTDIHFVPSVLHIFLEILGNKPLPSLKRVFCSGEGLNTELSRKFFESSLTSELHNLYGPTEASVEVSYWKCSRDDFKRYPITPIGYPIRNIHFYIVDENNKVVPENQKGELLIGGIGVAAGYYKMGSLTMQKFVDDPLDPSKGKVYKTGDLVLKNSDGIYEFFGRMDFQVKINGQRVELSEIENALMRIDSLARVSVLYEENLLFAFLEKKTPVEVEYINEFLRKFLPNYMIPAHFVFIENWPLNSSGKTDRNYLKKLISDSKW
jgi:fengycin family lipopeptide synthetase D